AQAQSMAELDLGTAASGGGPAGADARLNDRHGAAADAMAFDGGDRDLIHLLPRLAQPGTEPLAMDALADRELIALPAFGVLEIEARRKGLGRAGQDHDRGLEIVLEVARHVA